MLGPMEIDSPAVAHFYNHVQRTLVSTALGSDSSNGSRVIVAQRRRLGDRDVELGKRVWHCSIWACVGSRALREGNGPLLSFGRHFCASCRFAHHRGEIACNRRVRQLFPVGWGERWRFGVGDMALPYTLESNGGGPRDGDGATWAGGERASFRLDAATKRHKLSDFHRRCSCDLACSGSHVFPQSFGA